MNDNLIEITGLTKKYRKYKPSNSQKRKNNWLTWTKWSWENHPIKCNFWLIKTNFWKY